MHGDRCRIVIEANESGEWEFQLVRQTGEGSTYTTTRTATEGSRWSLVADSLVEDLDESGMDLMLGDRDGSRPRDQRFDEPINTATAKKSGPPVITSDTVQ